MNTITQTQRELLSAELADTIESEVKAAGCTGILRYAMQAVFGLGARERIIGGQDPDGNHFSINSVESWQAFQDRGYRAEPFRFKPAPEPEPEPVPEPGRYAEVTIPGTSGSIHAEPIPPAEPELSAEQIAALQPTLASLRGMAKRRELAWQRWTELKGRRGVTAAKDEYKRLDFAIDSALWPVQMQLGGRAALTLAYQAIDAGRQEGKAEAAKQAGQFKPKSTEQKIADALAQSRALDSAAPGLYVSGNTYPYRRELRSAGGDWRAELKCWYFAAAELPVSLRGLRGLEVRTAGTAAQIAAQADCQATAGYIAAQEQAFADNASRACGLA